MEIGPGSIVSIVGESGCGKTSLLKAINKLAEEEGGRVLGEAFLNGEKISNLSKEKLRQKIGMLFQEPYALPFSVKKNLSYVLNYHYKLTEAELSEKIESYLKLVHLYEELDGDLDLFAEKLSGGQRQRLALARCLAVEPEILLLDEPCSALDIKNTVAIEESLLDLKNKHTFIIVTHNLSQAKRISDEIIFMEAGRIVEQTDTEQFFSSSGTENAKNFIKYMDLKDR